MQLYYIRMYVLHVKLLPQYAHAAHVGHVRANSEV